METERIILTCALLYANGPMHIGHLVEYVQGDIIARALKLQGINVSFICADDTHGAPIEISATQSKITPVELIKKYYKEHVEDFKAFNIQFDSYYSTHTEENKYFTQLFFKRMLDKKLIYVKEMELNYCPTCQRFLPDRYIKGKCPICKAEDQYGDVCENCNSTYNTTDLIDSYCVVCKGKPTLKKSMHYFFSLSKFSKELEAWVKNNQEMQKEIKNQILSWIKQGLQDWCMSRDAPYFGFKIPNTDKYFYVWFDAPIGYIASFANLLDKDVKKAEGVWNSSKIVHIIGKDIIYFHLLFWPAMLTAAEFNMPSNVIVHGFLTVNKEKMSKSRGTYFTAKQFLKIGNPEHLRYYYAANLPRSMTDIDLDFKDYVERINNELVGNIANFIYRTLSFCNKYQESKVGKDLDTKFLSKIKKEVDRVLHNYRHYRLRKVVKSILLIAGESNKYFQSNEPWKLIKDNPKKASEVISTSINLVKYLILALKPIMPLYAAKIEQQINLKDLNTTSIDQLIKDHKINKAEIIYKKIEPINLDLKKGDNSFSRLNLKVAQVLEVKEHPEAEKLYILKVDLGKEKRQIVAGLREHYTPEQLKGKNILVVTNLQPAKLRGVVSKGMLLAAEDKKNVGILYVDKAVPGEQVIITGAKPGKKHITIKEFQKIPLLARDGKVFCSGRKLKTETEKIKIDKVKDGVIK